jgi:hypothetical protein
MPTVVAEVIINPDTPASNGTDQLIVQFLVDGAGQGQLLAIFHVPSAPNPYPSYNLASTFGTATSQLIAPGAMCHVSIDVNPLAPSGSLAATCNGHTVQAVAGSPDGVPRGVSGATILDIGFQNADGAPPFGHTNVYDNLVFRASP